MGMHSAPSGFFMHMDRDTHIYSASSGFFMLIHGRGHTHTYTQHPLASSCTCMDRDTHTYSASSGFMHIHGLGRKHTVHQWSRLRSQLYIAWVSGSDHTANKGRKAG